MEKNTIDDANSARWRMTEAVRELGNLADSAEHLGLKGLASRLWDLSAEIRGSAQKLYQAWSDECHSHCDTVEQNTTNVVKAALVGVGLAESKREEDDDEQP